ncbi:septum site-determining protein MinC [soil metagenome]
MSKTQTKNPVEIKISTVVAISAVLHEADPALLHAAMQEMTGGEADYFDDEFAVIDVGSLDPAESDIDWPALLALFRSYRLNPVAVRNAAPDMEAAIRAHGLSLDVVVQPRRAVDVPQEAEPQQVPSPPTAESVPAPSQPSARPTMIVDTPVRAGQRIYARDCDLIVTAAVNNGAEVIADGSIHIYAPLRGRALAGASGNPDARIFTWSMEAELVSIAGVYRTFEDGFPATTSGHPAQIRLVGNRLDVKAMQLGAKS